MLCLLFHCVILMIYAAVPGGLCVFHVTFAALNLRIKTSTDIKRGFMEFKSLIFTAVSHCALSRMYLTIMGSPLSLVTP